MKIPENIKPLLKIPFGILLKDVTKNNLSEHISEDSFLISVGDATTEKILSFGFTPFLQIIDGFEKRSKRNLPQNIIDKQFCNNPAGEITFESIEIIKKALANQRPTQIIVNGEEDLLVIPTCLYAPNNSTIMYGQPNEGLVIIHVTDEIRSKIRKLMDVINDI